MTAPDTGAVLLIGAGRMGAALIRGWVAAKRFSNIHVIEPQPGEGIAALAEQGVTYAVVGGATVATVTSGLRNFQFGAAKRYDPFSVSTDIRTQYRWSNNITFFAALDNVQDLPTFGGDLRRSYRAGIRFNY